MTHDADEWDPLARGLNALEATQLSTNQNCFRVANYSLSCPCSADGRDFLLIPHTHPSKPYELFTQTFFINWENPQSRYTMLTLRKIIDEKLLLHVRICMRIC